VICLFGLTARGSHDSLEKMGLLMPLYSNFCAADPMPSNGQIMLRICFLFS
jgi:hypothetical protein